MRGCHARPRLGAVSTTRQCGVDIGPGCEQIVVKPVVAVHGESVVTVVAHGDELAACGATGGTVEVCQSADRYDLVECGRQEGCRVGGAITRSRNGNHPRVSKITHGLMQYIRRVRIVTLRIRARLAEAHIGNCRNAV